MTLVKWFRDSTDKNSLQGSTLTHPDPPPHPEQLCSLATLYCAHVGFSLMNYGLKSVHLKLVIFKRVSAGVCPQVHVLIESSAVGL